jgi:amino acid permease
MKNMKNLFNVGTKSTSSQEKKCVGNFITIQNDPYKILRVIPIFVFGFTCQQNIFAVTNELRLPTQERISGKYMHKYL